MSRGPESLQFLLELAKDHGDDAKLADMQQVVDMLIPIGRTPESLWRYSCKNFDPVKRKCRIYDSRPTLCREYGTEKNPCEHRGCQWKDAVHSYDVKTPT
jgi:Fe-S-cluster containining protein